jgi:hypothetical protein
MCLEERSLVESLECRRRCLRGRSVEWVVSQCCGEGQQGAGEAYVFDGDEVTSGLLDRLVYDTETSAPQFLQHVIVVGHCGISKGWVHCYEACAAAVLSSLMVAAGREKMSVTIETGACMRVVWSGLLYQIVCPRSSESLVLVMSH